MLSDGQLDEVFVKQSRVLLCIMLTYANVCEVLVKESRALLVLGNTSHDLSSPILTYAG